MNLLWYLLFFRMPKKITNLAGVVVGSGGMWWRFIKSVKIFIGEWSNTANNGLRLLSYWKRIMIIVVMKGSKVYSSFFFLFRKKYILVIITARA